MTKVMSTPKKTTQFATVLLFLFLGFDKSIKS